MHLQLHLQIVGALLLTLALVNIYLPKRLNWKEDAAKMTLLNAQIFQVHAFFIIVVLLLFGGLTLFYSGLFLQKGELNRLVLIGFTVFWAIRLLVQLLVYDKGLWQGNSFNTAMHVLFSLFWAYCASVYGATLARQF